MATQSYRERLKAARAEASARRKAEQAERQRQIELRCEVHRLALADGQSWHSGQGAEEAIDVQPGRADDDDQCDDCAVVH